MNEHARLIRELLERVRGRWRRLVLLHGVARGALASAGVLALALLLSHWTNGRPVVLATIGLIAVAAGVAAFLWGLWPARLKPSYAQVARFIEERDGSLDDRLVSAVDVIGSAGGSDAAVLAGPMLADAARSTSHVDPAAIVPAERLRKAVFQAAAAVLLLIVVGASARDTIGRAIDAVALVVFPEHIELQVVPGNARIEAGAPLTIEAHLVGNRAPVVAQFLRAEGEGDWRPTNMSGDVASGFRMGLPAVGASFKYRIAAGTVTSPIYEVTVARAPRVTRIDVDYTYPPALRLPPRREEDSGDIYAPAGTDVRLHVHTDRAAAVGQLTLANGRTIALAPESVTELTAALKIVEDNSYRIALADAEGLKSPGDTEYFIRTLADRPPDVHIMKPARDRSVTPLEEVEIEAHAEDDYGIDRLELVYSLHGTEKVVPLSIPRRATAVTAAHTLYLEDLGVAPGDLIAYYARARDITRGTRSNEARSDIFFLEVKPFEQEFALAQSQSGAGGSGNQSIDDLVNAQKEVIVATWKLDRRAKAADGAKSDQDIQSVARAEKDLKTRVEETSSSFRESTMRDPRRRPQAGRGGDPGTPRAGQTLPEEDAMTAAANAMGKATASLEATKTTEALPPEMEALNHLLKAQSDVKKREIAQQQAGSGVANNRSNVDMSSLFDKELQRQQQTNYETPTSANERDDKKESAIDKIRDLARRQDELNKRQAELARRRAQMSAEDLKRELDKLTREQSDLRQRAEDLAREMSQQGQTRDSQQAQAGEQTQGGQQNQPGQQSQSGQQPGQQSAAGRRGSTGEAGQSGQRQPGKAGQPAGPNAAAAGGQQLRDASEEMRNAASDLRRQDPNQASERGARALEKLRDLEQQLQAGGPDERRRALGDLQMEARQLAEAERQAASEAAKAGRDDAAADALRRLAGDQERLAERARRVQEGLKQAGSAAASPGATNKQADGNRQRAASDAAREIERQRLPDRMRDTAASLRSAAGQSSSTKPDPAKAREQAAKTSRDQQEIARAFDKLADALANADRPADAASQKLADERARAQALRQQLDQLTNELSKLDEQARSGAQQGRAGASQKSNDQSGKPAQGGAGGGTGSADVAQLRDEYTRELQKVKELVDELRREDPTLAQGGVGFTFEGQGMVLSAPGTEAFKQDFSRWEQLRQQATQALETAETSLSKKLQEKEARDRLAAGADDKAPAAYQSQVDSYFKALAKKKN